MQRRLSDVRTDNVRVTLADFIFDEVIKVCSIHPIIYGHSEAVPSVFVNITIDIFHYVDTLSDGSMGFINVIPVLYLHL